MDDGLEIDVSQRATFVRRCLSLDLEVDPVTSRLFAFAAVRPDDDQSFVFKRGRLDDALVGLDRFARNAEFLLGHNIIRFDLPHLAASSGGSDPELDARLVLEVLADQLDATRELQSRSPHLLATYHWLTTIRPDESGFDAVFAFVRGCVPACDFGSGSHSVQLGLMRHRAFARGGGRAWLYRTSDV
jgi:ATP-dependent DNA helicase RecQ